MNTKRFSRPCAALLALLFISAPVLTASAQMARPSPASGPAPIKTSETPPSPSPAASPEGTPAAQETAGAGDVFTLPAEEKGGRFTPDPDYLALFSHPNTFIPLYQEQQPQGAPKYDIMEMMRRATSVHQQSVEKRIDQMKEETTYQPTPAATPLRGLPAAPEEEFPRQ